MKKQAKILEFRVIIEQDEDGWYIAQVPELPSCYTQGKTVEEAKKRIKEVIELVLECEPEWKKEKIASPKLLSSFFAVENINIPYA